MNKFVAEGLRFELRKELPLCRFSRPAKGQLFPEFESQSFRHKFIHYYNQNF